MNRRFIAVMIVVAVAMFASVAIAHGVRHQRATMGRGTHQGMWERLKTELNLTPVQVNAIKDIKQSFLTSTQTTRDQIKAKKQQMMQMVESGNVDPAALKALAHDINNLTGQLIDPGVDAMVAAYNVLTPQQQTKLQSIIKAHVQKYGAEKGMDMFGH